MLYKAWSNRIGIGIGRSPWQEIGTLYWLQKSWSEHPYTTYNKTFHADIKTVIVLFTHTVIVSHTMYSKISLHSCSFTWRPLWCLLCARGRWIGPILVVVGVGHFLLSARFGCSALAQAWASPTRKKRNNRERERPIFSLKWIFISTHTTLKWCQTIKINNLL